MNLMNQIPQRQDLSYRSYTEVTVKNKRSVSLLFDQALKCVKNETDPLCPNDSSGFISLTTSIQCPIERSITYDVIMSHLNKYRRFLKQAQKGDRIKKNRNLPLLTHLPLIRA